MQPPFPSSVSHEPICQGKHEGNVLKTSGKDYSFFFFFFFFVFLPFLGLLLRHMEVPRLRVESLLTTYGSKHHHLFTGILFYFIFSF